MEQYAERTFGGLTVRIDRWACVGYGDCMGVAPDIFEFDERGLCSFRADAGEIDRDRLILACDICPVDVLTLYDADGTQLV